MDKHELINLIDDHNMKTISKNIIHNENTEILYNIGNACIMYLEDDDKIKYLKEICNKLIDLTYEYFKYINDERKDSEKKSNDDVEKETCENICKNLITNPGAVGAFVIDKIDKINHIKGLINFLNFRELINIIVSFLYSSCNIMIWAVATDNHNLNSEFKKNLTKKIKNVSGFDVEIFNEVLNKKLHFSGDIRKVLCGIVTVANSGSVISARYNEYPFGVKARKHRGVNSFNYADFLKGIGKKIYPPLSERENKIYEDVDKYIPKDGYNKPNITCKNESPANCWSIGYTVWELEENNYYNLIAKLNSQIIVAGPSGGTNDILFVLSMFNNFDLNIGIIASIGWLVSTMNHSTYEILFASIPYGLNDWNPGINAEKYVIEKIIGGKEKYNAYIKRLRNFNIPKKTIKSKKSRK